MGFGYILYKDMELEMEDDKVVCIKYKGERVAEIVNEDLDKDFEKSLKLGISGS